MRIELTPACYGRLSPLFPPEAGKCKRGELKR